MNKKKILSLALVLLLICTISFGTLAWFNDKEEITNTFYVASSENDIPGSPEDIFSVDIYEKVDTDGNGTIDDEESNGAIFENILPAEVISKAPFVKNTGKYDQWVRLTITFEDQDAWYKVFNGNVVSPLAMLTFAEDFEENWIGGHYDQDHDAYIYAYYSQKPLAAGHVLNTFTEVKIPEQLTQEDMFNIKELTLKVKAEAVQADNLGDDIITGKAAFERANWEFGTNYND